MSHLCSNMCLNLSPPYAANLCVVLPSYDIARVEVGYVEAGAWLHALAQRASGDGSAPHPYIVVALEMEAVRVGVPSAVGQAPSRLATAQ